LKQKERKRKKLLDLIISEKLPKHTTTATFALWRKNVE
jgi:hypothetical protein